MTLFEAAETLQRIEEALRATYPHAFSVMPKAAWEVRIKAGTSALEKAISQLRSAVSEVEPNVLRFPGNDQTASTEAGKVVSPK